MGTWRGKDKELRRLRTGGRVQGGRGKADQLWEVGWVGSSFSLGATGATGDNGPQVVLVL